MIMICTYLKCRLLRAPRKYVLHDLDPGLDWAFFWPSTPCAFRVATPHSVSCCLFQMDQVSHLSPSLHCDLGGFSLMSSKQHNNVIQRYMTHMDTQICMTLALLFFFLPSFLHFLHLYWQAGWPRPFWSDTGTLSCKCRYFELQL